MSESIQKKLMRVRPPRVRITYDVETRGAIGKNELPFIVGVLADLQGDMLEGAEVLPLTERRFVDIERDSFDDVLRAVGPGVYVRPTMDGQEGLKGSTHKDACYLRFTSLSDFDPPSVIRAVPTLRAIYHARTGIRWLQSKVETSTIVADQLASWLNLEPVADTTNTPEVRTLLPAALHAKAPDAPSKATLLADLTALAVALRKLPHALDAAATAPADDDAKTTAETARKAAFDALDKWNLKKGAAYGDAQLLAWGRLLADALALPNTAENRDTATKLVKLLGTAPTAHSKDPTVIERDKARAGAMAALGLAEGVNANKLIAEVQAGLDAPQAPQYDCAIGIALFLAGLNSDAHVETTMPNQEPERSLYLNDSVAAAGRAAFLDLAGYLHGDANAGTMAPELLQLIEHLRPNEMMRVPAIVQRLRYFVSEVVVPWQLDDAALLQAEASGLGGVIDCRVAQIDATLNAAVSSIMHTDSFRTLEAGWRGLHYLVSRSETGTMLRIKLLNATKTELLKDLETAAAFDQSMLFRQIRKAEYGTHGGSPYNLLVGDYPIGRTALDIEFARKMAEVAAAAHAPFIAAASSEFFGMETDQGLEAWREFREREDSRYVTLVLPRVLLRLPYGQAGKRNTIPRDDLDFVEQIGTAGLQQGVDGDIACRCKPASEDLLWGNAAYVLAERITHAFSLYGWTAAIHGVEGGGLVESLPAYSYASDDGTVELYSPTEVTITDRRAKQLSDLGFMSLCHYKGTATAAFFGGDIAKNPKTYISNEANTNAKAAAMLPYMLTASRFAHYIKVIMRKRIDAPMTRAEVESFLNDWIANYVLLDDNVSQDTKAAFPLRAANVAVAEVPGAPAVYNATVFLKPHFQLEELSTSIRLVVKLPARPLSTRTETTSWI